MVNGRLHYHQINNAQAHARLNQSGVIFKRNVAVYFYTKGEKKIYYYFLVISI